MTAGGARPSPAGTLGGECGRDLYAGRRRLAPSVQPRQGAVAAASRPAHGHPRRLQHRLHVKKEGGGFFFFSRAAGPRRSGSLAERAPEGWPLGISPPELGVGKGPISRRNCSAVPDARAPTTTVGPPRRLV